VSHHAETKYVCNVCDATVNIATANGPLPSRVSAPDGWTTLWITDPVAQPSHFCPECTKGFEDFLHDKKRRGGLDVQSGA
jgi:hypothetical protein